MNACYAIRNRHACQCTTAIKSSSADAGHSISYNRRMNLFGVIVPRRNIIVIRIRNVAIHVSISANRQGAIAVKHPANHIKRTSCAAKSTINTTCRDCIVDRCCTSSACMSSNTSRFRSRCLHCGTAIIIVTQRRNDSTGCRVAAARAMHRFTLAVCCTSRRYFRRIHD